MSQNVNLKRDGINEVPQMYKRIAKRKGEPA